MSDLHPLREATTNNLQRVKYVQEIEKNLKHGPRGVYPSFPSGDIAPSTYAGTCFASPDPTHRVEVCLEFRLGNYDIPCWSAPI